MLIHEVSKITGLSIPTIRYYEQERLLNKEHVRRSPNNYRSYTLAAVKRLEHFKHARAAGLTLQEIKKLTTAFDNGTLSTEERREFLTEKIATLSQKIVALEAIRQNFELELEQLSR